MIRFGFYFNISKNPDSVFREPHLVLGIFIGKMRQF